MLVVTRKPGESILVSDNIEISVLEISKDKVKIGINAPKEVKIVRSELKTLRQTNEQAAASTRGIKQLLNDTQKREER
ncbi:MAG: carbon storage regulator CsrA [Oscillospiraceae bacterium]|nr:carbon storage regulator CsrA [Oscillospiraceae bacterium]